jgi:hypothetical protein
MVAQIDTEVFHPTLCTPERDPFDSEGVLLAVETARGLEGEGDFAGAVQWLRRAVREAEKQGNVVRAEDLARAAEELEPKADAAGERIFPSSAPLSNPRQDRSMEVVGSNLAAVPFSESRALRSAISVAPPAPSETGSIPPLLAALISSMPPFSHRTPMEIPPPSLAPSESTPPLSTSPPFTARSRPCSQPPNAESGSHAVSASAANDNIAVDTVQNADSRPSRVCAFRAAIPASGECTSSFFIQRLANGEAAPAGMVEAMIVVIGESDGRIGFETSLRTSDGAGSRRR